MQERGWGAHHAAMDPLPYPPSPVCSTPGAGPSTTGPPCKDFHGTSTAARHGTVAAAVEQHERRAATTVLGTPVRQSFRFDAAPPARSPTRSPTRVTNPAEMSVDLWGKRGGSGGQGSPPTPPRAVQPIETYDGVRCSRVFVLYIARVLVQVRSGQPVQQLQARSDPHRPDLWLADGCGMLQPPCVSAQLPCKLTVDGSVQFVFNVSELVATAFMLQVRSQLPQPKASTDSLHPLNLVGARHVQEEGGDGQRLEADLTAAVDLFWRHTDTGSHTPSACTTTSDKLAFVAERARTFAAQCEAVSDELSANMHMTTVLPAPLAAALSTVRRPLCTRRTRVAVPYVGPHPLPHGC
jgi:hypothetical protein